MDYLTTLNDSVFNSQGNALYIVNEYSDIIKYNSFTTTQNNTPIWTPAFAKSIYLTAISISSSLALNIALSRASNASFLVLQLTSTFQTYNANYCSPVKFDTNESINISFSILVTGGVNVTLFGFEK